MPRTPSPRRKRMSRREAGRLGGKISGGNFRNDPDRAREAGRKGGQSVSRDRKHMARIGRKGGEA